MISDDVDKEDCLILQKAIYGLVQAAREFWKKIVDKMQEGGFQLSKVDPCMLYREDERGVCIIIIFIDDMLIISKEEAIDDGIKVFQDHFQVKIQQVWKIIWVFKLYRVMMARKPSWGNQQLLRVWRNNLERELQRRK